MNQNPTTKKLARVWAIALEACDNDESRAQKLIFAAFQLVMMPATTQESNNHATL